MKLVWTMLLVLGALYLVSKVDHRDPDPGVSAPTQLHLARAEEISSVDSLIASDLYSSDAILEFKDGGRPFETTLSSQESNRQNQLRRIAQLKTAASANNRTIEADLHLYRVAWKSGFFDEKRAALKKLISDIASLTPGNQNYNTNTPLGQIIAAMQHFRDKDDVREQKDRAAQNELANAKAAAGAR